MFEVLERLGDVPAVADLLEQDHAFVEQVGRFLVFLERLGYHAKVVERRRQAPPIAGRGTQRQAFAQQYLGLVVLPERTEGGAIQAEAADCSAWVPAGAPERQPFEK